MAHTLGMQDEGEPVSLNLCVFACLIVCMCVYVCVCGGGGAFVCVSGSSVGYISNYACYTLWMRHYSKIDYNCS